MMGDRRSICLSRGVLPKAIKLNESESTRNLVLVDTPRTSYSRDPTPDILGEKGSAEHDDEPMTFRRMMVLVAMGFLWTSSQIPIYFYGAVQINVLQTLGGYSLLIWVGLAGILPLAIVTPFVGALSDLFGRRNIGIASFFLIIVGNVLCAAAPHMSTYLAGMILIGLGAGIGELVALAVTAEIAPAKNRGLYVGAIVATILPFAPSTLYAQMIAHTSTWRWIGLLIGGWSFIGFVLTAIFYRPPPTKALITRRELLRQIDWTGGFLSAVAICLVLIGLSLPTSGYSWSDTSTLASLIIGSLFTIGFIVWEWQSARYPMFPARLKEKHPRTLAVVLLITFVSGANFFAVLIYWPTQYQNVYADDNPFSGGIGSLPVSLGIILGSIVVSALITILKGRIRTLLVISTVVMVAFNGAMAASTKENLPAMWVVVTIACFAIGGTLVPVQIIAGLICPDDLLATITAVTITVRIIGGCLSYAIYTNIFASTFASEAATSVIPMLVELGISSTEDITQIVDVIRGGGFKLLSSYPGIETEAQVVAITAAGKDALMKSYPVVYFASITFGVLSIVASFFLTGIEEEMSDKAAVKLG